MDPENLKCAECQYDLTGLAKEDRCPECGTRLLLSAGFATNAAALRRDNAILRKKTYYDRNRRGAWGLSLLPLTLLVATMFSPVLARGLSDPLWMSTMINSIVLWGLIGLVNHVLYRHAESLERYRGILDEVCDQQLPNA